MDDKQILQIQKRARAYAFKILRNNEDAEDFASLAVIEAIERHRRNRTTQFKIEWLVIDCLRRELGKQGSRRAEFSRALRYAKGIKPGLDDSEEPGAFVSEESIHSVEPGQDRRDAFLDEELLERAGGSLDDDKNQRGEARERGVTESRVSQLRKAERERFVKRYLWEHYKENGIESELEVDWITL